MAHWHAEGVDILASRVILRPADYAQTLVFYRDALGLAIAREYPHGTVFYAGQSLIEIAGHSLGPGSQPTQPTKDPAVNHRSGALWLQVRNVSAAVADLEQRGVTIDRLPAQEPWGLIEAWLRDPDGVPIVLVEVPSEHPLRRAVTTSPQ